MIIGLFPRFSNFAISVSTESIIAFVFSGSIVRYAPCSVCFTEDMISCSTFGSSVTTLVTSFAGKYLFEIARLRLCRTYSVNTSVSLEVDAWSANVSKMVSRSLMEIPSLSRFCNTF